MNSSLLLPLLQFFARESIFFRVSTSDEEISWSQFSACLDLHGTFLYEATEGCKTGAGAEHDYWVFDVVWRMEITMGRLTATWILSPSSTLER
jgi:hypothetical protein